MFNRQKMAWVLDPEYYGWKFIALIAAIILFSGIVTLCLLMLLFPSENSTITESHPTDQIEEAGE